MDMESALVSDLDTLVKFDLKVLAADPAEVEAEEFIPVFHRWITERVLPELLIDVADYSHVHEGPGVLLVGHDAIYAYDLSRGEPGLLYSRRHESGAELEGIGSLDDRLRSLLECAFRVCDLIEAEPNLGGRVAFDRHRLELRVNDRLFPSDKATAVTLAGAFQRALAEAGVHDGDAPVQVKRIGESRERLTLRTG
ncbi:MAG: hypothetical protein F4X59_10090 [Holophagales bacterium]|nr:hypothetical protein [Holophagales bacterium]MXX62814.1 hypothetical protein [Holophagales bacterium]MYC10466.1 hypothetical protein [Holophagales bacterium]MYD21862.1 hypothetical protein [Holophagales bacterium]MYI31941.1 hypothetical protein [Holophagales bacterium]